MPPLEGEVPNEREAEGFVRKLSKKTPQSARSGYQLPFQGSQGGFAARVARLATLQWADTFIRVLAKIRGYGRILSAPTERVPFILLYVLKSNLSY